MARHRGIATTFIGDINILQLFREVFTYSGIIEKIPAVRKKAIRKIGWKYDSHSHSSYSFLPDGIANVCKRKSWISTKISEWCNNDSTTIHVSNLWNGILLWKAWAVLGGSINIWEYSQDSSIACWSRNEQKEDPGKDGEKEVSFKSC